MALSYSTISELDAVNMMLLAIGESPVNGLDDKAPADASVARTRLHQVSREVQNIGWHWNREESYPLAANEDGYIYVPASALRCDPSDDLVDYVVRGNRVYDRVNHTYSFEPGVVEHFDITFFLPWDELPQAAREYITRCAARQFQEDTVGAPELSRMDRADEVKAWAALLHDEAQVADHNILTGSPSVSRVLDRWL